MSPLNNTAFVLAGVALLVAILPLIRELPLTLIVVALLFLAAFLNRHVVAYGTSSDGAKEAMVHRVTT